MDSKADFRAVQTEFDPLLEAVRNYQLLHIEAYIVYLDMVLHNEVAYKLTPDSITTLIEYHKEVHCVDAETATYSRLQKEQQARELHKNFVQAINGFVFHTHVSALEGLEEEGTGELLCGKSEEVKNIILALMKPLLTAPHQSTPMMSSPSLFAAQVPSRS